MKNTILLIQPGHSTLKPRIPVNYLAVAAELMNNGFKVIIADLRVFSWEEAMKEVDWNDVVLVGLSCYTGPMIYQTIDVAKKIRTINPQIPIVWGGIHPTIAPETTAKHELVDVCVKGDGEETITELAKKFQNNEPIDEVLGIYFKKNETVMHTADRPVYDLNKIGILPYDLVDTKNYDIKEFSMNMTRGCPYKCIFCYNLAFDNQRFRGKDALGVVDEIEYVMKRWNPEIIMFVEDNTFTNKKRMEDICREVIKRGLKIKWMSSTRADYIARHTDEYMQLLKDSGCVMLTFGAESGSQRMLDEMQKHLKVEDTIKAVEKLKKFDIKGRISFVYGLPGETKEETLMTVNLIKKLKQIHPKLIVNGMFIATMYPNTPLAELAKQADPNFAFPETLEGWADWQHYQSGFQPWMEKQYAKEMETASHIIRFQCLKDMDYNAYLKNVPIRLAARLGNGLFNIPASIRWKTNYYKFGYEMKLWNKLVFAFLGNI